jgi:hypothetical protein
MTDGDDDEPDDRTPDPDLDDAIHDVNEALERFGQVCSLDDVGGAHEGVSMLRERMRKLVAKLSMDPKKAWEQREEEIQRHLDRDDWQK